MNTFEEKYKSTIDLLYNNIKEKEDKKRKKPLIPHLLRVGKYLHKNNFSEDVVNAGLLHDAIEWMGISEKVIKNKYNEHVLNIVLANTKNRNIDNSIKRREDYVNRCVKVGIDALIVKAADVIDSYYFYKKIKNTKEILRSQNIAELILKKVKKLSKIFQELNEIL